MNSWWRRIRGAVGTGLTWAVVWAPVAVIVGTQVIDPTDKMDEMWWMVGAMPGFISGIIFSVVLGVVARRRQLSELSIVHTAGWGSLAGLLTGILPFLLGDRGGEPVWPLAMIVISTLTLLSAVSAAGSLALAQRAQRSESLEHDASVNTVRTDYETPASIRAGMPRSENAAVRNSAVKHEPPVS